MKLHIMHSYMTQQVFCIAWCVHSSVK